MRFMKDILSLMPMRLKKMLVLKKKLGFLHIVVLLEAPILGNLKLMNILINVKMLIEIIAIRFLLKAM
jgi:hypothetical protein